jgi:hypothetical protein
VRQCVSNLLIVVVAAIALTIPAILRAAPDETSAAEAPAAPALSLRIPKEEKVSVAAIPNDDTVKGEPGSMLYYGPPAAALLGVVAHGMIESHRQAKEKKNRNSMVDLVLVPYQPALSRFTNSELMRLALQGLTTRGQKALIGFSEPAGPGWLIECSPKFLMTQDARALVLENSIVIHSPAASSPATFKNVVAVVGRPRERVGPDPENTWMIQDGEMLKAEIVDLMRESVDLALSELHGDFDGHAADFHTVRFAQGGVEKMERAQILKQTPQRVVLKTLRGWIMSVPAGADSTSAPPNVTASLAAEP